jgi:hypothetical protein
MRSNLMKSASFLILAALLAATPLAALAGQQDLPAKPAQAGEQDRPAKAAKVKRSQAKAADERTQSGKASAKRKHPAKSSSVPLQGAEADARDGPLKRYRPPANG